MEDIQIIDNALPQGLYSFIKNEMLRNEFQWSLSLSTAFENDGEVSFANTCYRNDNGTVLAQNEIFPYMHSAFLGFTSHLPGIKKLLRIRAGLILPTEKSKVHFPHIDTPKPHWTALLYFNTEENNGHTYFYEDRFDPQLYPSPEGPLQQAHLVEDVLKTVAPKENRLVIFRGDIFHSSSTPVDIPYRIAVNFNFTIE